MFCKAFTLDSEGFISSITECSDRGALLNLGNDSTIIAINPDGKIAVSTGAAFEVVSVFKTDHALFVFHLHRGMYSIDWEVVEEISNTWVLVRD